MSCITFTAETWSVDIRGTERAYAGLLTTDLLLTALGMQGPFSWHPEYVVNPPREDAPGADSILRTKVTIGTQMVVDPGDDENEPVHAPSFELAINTALVMGSDPIRLLARMHATCELHGYMFPHDRAFIADIIEEGVESGILRQYMSYYTYEGATPSGWLALAEHLRQPDLSPVVMSYSVCDSFPNYSIWSEGGNEGGYEEYAALSEGRQWSECFVALTKLRPWARLEEKSFCDTHIEPGTTAFDLVRNHHARSPDPAAN